MNFKKEDENYIYGVIGRNVKKYRKEKNLTQVELAEKIGYSLSFVSSVESKKHQTFSLGALGRISLVLWVDMYKLCIDEENQKNELPKFITYKCNKCNYETSIPYELVELLKKANQIYTHMDNQTPIFECEKCDGFIVPKK